MGSAMAFPWKCENCAFWTFRDHYTPTIKIGRCHWRPPVVDDPASTLAPWPVTAHNDWCGEYYPRPESAHELAEFEVHRRRARVG